MNRNPKLTSLAATIVGDEAFDSLQVYLYETLEEAETPRQTARRIFNALRSLSETFKGSTKNKSNASTLDDDGQDPDLR